MHHWMSPGHNESAEPLASSGFALLFRRWWSLSKQLSSHPQETKETGKTVGFAESKSWLSTVTANIFETSHGDPSQVLEKRFRRAWTAHGAVQFSSLSPSEIWSWAQSTRTKTPRCLRSIFPKSSASSCSQSYNYAPSIKVAIACQCEVDGGLARPPMVFWPSCHHITTSKTSIIYFWKCQFRHTGMSFFNILVRSSMNQSSMILWGTASPFHLEFWNDMCSVICNLLFY